MHPLLEPILTETNGVILYQEQVMRIANELAQFSLSEADTLRRAMGKKKKKLMAEFSDQFVEGAMKNDVPEKTATDIFKLIEKFAGYGFNKSHSAAYAVLSYQTGYLKANYPAEFMAAVMTCEMNNTDKIVEYLEECRRMEIEFKAPDINTSKKEFTVVDDTIWYGLEAIKGLGGKVVDDILDARDKTPFKSILDLCERIAGNSITKSALEQLTKSGAFDCFGKRRSQLVETAPAALKRGQQAREDKERGQMTFDFLSDTSGGDGAIDEAYPDIKEWSESEKLSMEKESLGFYLSGHPLQKWWEILKGYSTTTVERHLDVAENTQACIGALVTKLDKRVMRRTGEPFWIATIEDLKQSMELFINQELYERYGEILVADKIILVRGRIYTRANGKSFRVESIIPLEDIPEKMTRDLSIHLPSGNGDGDKLKYSLKNLLGNHKGKCPVYLVEPNVATSSTRIQVGREFFVTPDYELFEEIRNLFGENCLSINNAP